jgi:hypothetical protein
MARLRLEGSFTARELGGTKTGGTWGDWSETKIAAERWLSKRELVCRERLPARLRPDRATIPSVLADQEWSDDECTTALVRAAGRGPWCGHRGRPGALLATSAGTATSPCLCSEAGSSWAWSIRGVTVRAWWPNTSRAAALVEAAEWVGCRDVVVERVEPVERTSELVGPVPLTRHPSKAEASARRMTIEGPARGTAHE